MSGGPKPLARPQTYIKSDSLLTDSCMDKENPTREDLVAIVERDVLFCSAENRKKLLQFIKTFSP